MDFLPQGYDKLNKKRPYWNTKELKEGDQGNRLRIVMQPICGWMEWIDKKPKRYRIGEEPSVPSNPDGALKRFWAMYVWDYERKGLYVLEVTQAQIIAPIKRYALDPDWGDFRNYDIKIFKSGVGKETEYAVTAISAKPLEEEIKIALQMSPVRLEALFDGLDPWETLDGVREPLTAFKIEEAIVTAEQARELRELLCTCSPDYMKAMIKGLENQKMKSWAELPLSKYESTRDAFEKAARQHQNNLEKAGV